MADITPFTILNAFTRAEILCSVGYGPDGAHDSAGGAYEATVFDSLDAFLDGLVEEAGERESVVVEFQTIPQVDELGRVHASYTLREQNPQPPIAMKNQQR